MQLSALVLVSLHLQISLGDSALAFHAIDHKLYSGDNFVVETWSWAVAYLVALYPLPISWEGRPTSLTSASETPAIKDSGLPGIAGL